VKDLNDFDGLYQYTLRIETDEVDFQNALKAYFTNGPLYDQYKDVKGI